MSRFTAPSWDVDGGANTLCDNFSGSQKLPQSKRVRKKKHKARHGTVGKEPSYGKQLTFKKGNTPVQVRTKKNNSWIQKDFNKGKDGKGNSQKLPQSKRVRKKKHNASHDTVGKGPSYGKQLTIKKGNTPAQVKTKKNNAWIQKDFNKGKDGKGNVNGRHFKNHKGGNDEFGKMSFGNKQKLKNLKHNANNFIKSSEGYIKESFSNQKNYKKNEFHFNNGQKKLPDGNNLKGFKSLKENSRKDGKNKSKKGNFPIQNNSGDVSFRQENNKMKNRKRNSAHLSEFQNNGPSLKKKKMHNDGSNQEMYTSSRKEVVKGKGFHGQNKFNMQENEAVNNKSSKDRNGEIKSYNRFFDSSLSLRERMLLQLKSSRFRYINEQLYTSDSKYAEEMFRNDPNLFKVYHEGFQQQVEQWPENPVEKIIKAIQRKPANLVVADFGCGDAKLAKSISNKVHSFDLVALSDEVTVCDMAHTPLECACVDICVFCLSLMSTNLNSYLLEANRILKVGGTIKIAEVASRFTSVEKFIKDMMKYEFSLMKKDLSNDLFYFLDFKKVSNIKKMKGLPDLSLNPCWYKKR